MNGPSRALGQQQDGQYSPGCKTGTFIAWERKKRWAGSQMMPAISEIKQRRFWWGWLWRRKCPGKEWAASAVHLPSVELTLFLPLSHSTVQLFHWQDLLSITLPPPHPPLWTTGSSEWQRAGWWRAGESQPRSSFLAKKPTKVCLFLMTFLMTLSLSQKSVESPLNRMIGKN